jgi:hypothetical protein
MTTENQQAALAKAHVDTAFFAEFRFDSGTVRVSNFNQTVTWGGYDWTGIGSLGGISAIQESDSLTPQGLSFTLNVADPSLLALAVGPVEDYRGRRAKLYRCPLNENLQLIDTPEICWSGLMDMMSIGIGESGEGQISLKCESSAFGLKRRPILRINSAQQKKKYPNDTGLDYLTSLISAPTLWLSIKFQRQD